MQRCVGRIVRASHGSARWRRDRDHRRQPIAHAKSFIAKSTGNEVATSTGGGVITHMVQGMAYFQTFSMDVFIESQPAVRRMDLVTHNHMAMLPGNTPPAPWMSAMLAGPGPAMAGDKKQIDGLLPLQITSGADAGAWRQVLDRTDAWAESSCIAMFTYALVTGVKNGWLSGDKYVTAAKNVQGPARRRARRVSAPTSSRSRTSTSTSSPGPTISMARPR